MANTKVGNEKRPAAAAATGLVWDLVNLVSNQLMDAPAQRHSHPTSRAPSSRMADIRDKTGSGNDEM